MSGVSGGTCICVYVMCACMSAWLTKKCKQKTLHSGMSCTTIIYISYGYIIVYYGIYNYLII